MASSMAAAAAHSMPPFPLPAVPRIRPPPIPKGTPGPNTLPQPRAPPRRDLVWVDGRWASPHSRSANHRRDVVSKQLEKALRHEVHGMNIYAYKHIRTHQVIYSLTRNMDNNKMLKQLMYHGKKTVPAALRRDLWRPYFSVHFPQTPAGAMKGLRAFQELRELSALRQLSPPKEMSIATKKDIDDMKLSYDPIEWQDKTENAINNKKLTEPPVIGKRLPKQMLARRLMNQAATSVADVAAVLTRQTNPREWRSLSPGSSGQDVEALGPTPQQQRTAVIERQKAHEDTLSIRAHDRLVEIRKKEEAKAEQIEQRQKYLTPMHGMVKIDKHTTDRISMEYDGTGNKLSMIDRADEATVAEIGASQLLEQALQEMNNEKQTQTRMIEETMTAQINQRLSKLSKEERDELESDNNTQLVVKEDAIKTQISQLQADLKAQRDKLHQQPASIDRTKALRKLSRDSRTQIHAMKLDLRTRFIKWSGPYADIAGAVDKAISSVDAAWAPRIAELREEVNAEGERSADQVNHEVEIRWANIRDGTHAKSWPETVFHAELQQKAVSKQRSRTITTHFHLDADEEPIETQHGMTAAPRRNSVHVFGSVAPDADEDNRVKGRYESPIEMSTKQTEARNMRIQEWANTEAILLRDRIVTMRAEARALERQFANTDFDKETTPYIATSLECIERAQAILEKMDRNHYQPTDIEDIEAQLTYVRDAHPFCVDEIPGSSHPVADEARVEYAARSADVLELQMRNLDAYHQANMRESYFLLFDKREALVDSIDRFKNDATVRGQEEKELKAFDRQYPFIATIYARRETLAETLQSEIEDRTLELDKLKEELETAKAQSATPEQTADAAATLKDQIAHLTETIVAETKTLTSQTKQRARMLDENEAGGAILRDVLRADKEAWLEFKRAGGLDAYETGPSSFALAQEERERQREREEGTDAATTATTTIAAPRNEFEDKEMRKSRERKNQGMVMGNEETSPGVWGRVKNLFR